MPNDADNRKAFGEALDRELSARQMTKTVLAERLGLSNGHITRMMDGSRYTSAARVDEIAAAVGVSGDAVTDLHKAAAIAAGFKLDLTKPSKP